MSKLEQSPGGKTRGFFSRFFTPKVDKLQQAGDMSGLVEALGNRNEKVRTSAVVALGELGDRQVIAPVADVLHDSVRNVRIAAVIALGRLGGEEIIPPLTEALSDLAIDVRVQVIHILKHLPLDAAIIPPLKETISRTFGEDRTTLYDDRVEDQFPYAFYYNEGKRVRKEQLFRPNTPLHEAEQAAGKQVSEISEYMQISAIEIAEKIGSQEAIEFIEDIYLWTFSTRFAAGEARSRSTQILLSAVERAECTGGPEAVEFLDGLYTRSFYELKSRSLEALRTLHAPAPKQLIDLAVLDDINWMNLHGYGGYRQWRFGSSENEHIKLRRRIAALGDLANFAYDNHVWEILIDALSNGETDIVIAAAQALGKRKDSRAIPFLQSALTASHTYTRWDIDDYLFEQDDTEKVRGVIQNAIQNIQGKYHR